VARNGKPSRAESRGVNGDRPDDWFRTKANLSDIPTLPFPEDQVDDLIHVAARKAAIAAIQPPANLKSIRPVRGWAIAVAIASTAHLVTAFFAASRTFPEIVRVRTALANGVEPALAGTWTDVTALRWHVATGLLAVATTSGWLWTVRRNVEQIDRAGQRRRRIWVWLAWLVPIINYWYPFQIVRDVGESSQRPKLPYRSWWAAWVVAVFLQSHGLSPFPVYAPLPMGMTNLEVYLGTGVAALVVAFPLWLVIVRGITRAQTDVYRLALESRPDLSSGIPAQRAADLTE